MPTREDFTYTNALFNVFRNVMNYSNWWKIDWFDCIENSANLKQGTYIHQPVARSVPLARAQPWFHAGSGNYRQLFHPYCRGPPARQSHWVNERENSRLKNPLLPKWVQSSLSSASSTQHMWELLAGNRTAVLPRHARGRWIMGLVYVCPVL